VVLLDGDVVDELGGLAGVDELVVADGDEGDDEGCDADGACEAEGAAEGVAAEVGAAEVCACAAALLNINATAAAAVERLSLVICHPSCQFQV
jgi:hypothetical protein